MALMLIKQELSYKFIVPEKIMLLCGFLVACDKYFEKTR